MENNKNKNGKKIISTFLIVLVLVIGYFTNGGISFLKEIFAQTFAESNIQNARVHFIDVGQGDSILIESEGKYMLIDAGENDKGEIVEDYLKKEGIETLDYVVGTHPHSDHIGGLDVIIQNFNVKQVIMPAVSHTTKTYADVIKAIQNKNLEITIPKPSETYSLGEAKFTIFAPVKEYEELNNTSVGIRFVHGENAFVFTGDAEKKAENDILQSNQDLSAKVFKLAHHGSTTSNSTEFLNAINPEYAIICVGKDNTYGHPHREIMAEMEKRNISVYRTDLNGTIIITSDGKTLNFQTEK